jgi:hypothetical protein
MDAPRHLFPSNFVGDEPKPKEVKPILSNEPIIVGDIRKVNWLYMS